MVSKFPKKHKGLTWTDLNFHCTTGHGKMLLPGVTQVQTLPRQSGTAPPLNPPRTPRQGASTTRLCQRRVGLPGEFYGEQE